MSKTYRDSSESDTLVLESFTVAPWEKEKQTKIQGKMKKQELKEMTKSEKIDVVYRLIDYFRTH